MRAVLLGVVEILGLFLSLAGMGAIAAAAAMVSIALAVLVGGVFALLLGIVAVYVAASLDRPQLDLKPGPKQP